MDTLYIGDIPQDYHYARFGTNYIDLYNTPTLSGTKDFYRVYMYDNYFAYDTGTTTYNYQTYYARDINVTDNKWYRRDMPFICLETAILIIFFIFIFNIVTSVFRKGGVFGGLL